MPRQRVFDADTALVVAMETFWARGYNGSSIQVLLDAMGINRGSLYASFGNKEDLFRSALDLYYRAVTQVVIGLLEQAHSPTQGVVAMFELTLVTLPDHQRRKGCLLINTVAELSETDPELARLASQRLTMVRAALKQTLQRAIEVGEWRNDDADPSTTADLLFNFMTGLRVNARMQFDTEQIRRSVVQTLRLIGLDTGDLSL